MMRERRREESGVRRRHGGRHGGGEIRVWSDMKIIRHTRMCLFSQRTK